MEFHLLRTFHLVASFMSFNAAAKALHCTQSTVSAQIKALEHDLGTPMFERLGRRIALTPAGQELQRHTRRLLSYEHDIRTAITMLGETLGLISLRAPQSVALHHLPHILRGFCAAYPRVGFDISNCGYFQLTEELRTGAIDAGFLLSMTIGSVDLHTTVVLSEPMAYVTGPGSDLAARSKLTIADLAGQTLLLPKHDCAYRMDLERRLKEGRIETAAIIELNSVAALIECLRAGLGVALLPRRAVAPDLAAGRLLALDWHETLAADLFLVRHRDKPLTGAYGAFIEAVETYFAEQRRLQPAARQPAQGDDRSTCEERACRSAEGPAPSKGVTV